MSKSPFHPFDRRARTAFYVVCATLTLSTIAFRSAVAFLNVHLQKEPVDLRDHFNNISDKLGRWEVVLDGEPLTEEMVEELGTDLYLNRDYAVRGEGERVIRLHLAYYTGMIDAVPHVPDRCLVAAGFDTQENPRNIPLGVDTRTWQIDPGPVNRATGEPYRFVEQRDPATGRPITVRMPIGDFALRTTEFSHTKNLGRRFYGGYFFVANGRVAVTPEQVKILAFDMAEEYAYYCKVQFFAYGDESYEIDAFIEEAQDLLGELLPELMRCLPDWAEVEARSAHGSATIDDS